MKKKIISITLTFITATLLLVSCKKSTLQLANPNSPTPASLTSESGILDFATGVYAKWLGFIPGNGTGNGIWDIVLENHSIMGDEEFIPWGNFGWRTLNEAYSVTLPNNQTIVNPLGVNQKATLVSSNSRQAGELNSLMYEWEDCYFMIGQSNLLLNSLGNSALHFTGDAETKKNTLYAWAYWWKAFCYSRIGSMYIAGIINNEPANGVTNGDFVDRKAVIDEATHNFDTCLSYLDKLQENDDYDAVMNTVIPSFNQDPGGVISPEMWKRQVYSYEARNILVNTPVKDMTDEQWQQILALANKGVEPGDNTFQFGMEADANNDLSGGFWHPYALHNLDNGFCFMSPRIISDFTDTSLDKRYKKNFYELPPSQWEVNVRSRGLTFGTFWQPKNIEDGGSFCTSQNLGQVSIACTYEENELMKAEALIYTNQISDGLEDIDEVRNYQGAGLAPLLSSLTKDQAVAQLHSERRIALYLRGVAFYDARRWGVTQKGVGKEGIVIVPGNLIGGGSAKAMMCKIDYDYVDYFDVPQNELDFNTPSSGSAPVKE